jgi:hypothetical protein
MGPHSIDRLATQGITPLPRYNARWRDPTSEAVDCLHLPVKLWPSETNSCNPAAIVLPEMFHKLRQFGAEATVIAP